MGDMNISIRRLALACAEGIFFSSAFLGVFYFRQKGKLKNIIFANELISSDEGLHKVVGETLYGRDGKLSDDEAHDIVGTFVEVECEFVDYAIPEDFEDFTAADAKNYVRYLADHLLVSTGHPSLYGIRRKSLPSWMNDIAMQQKGNFYEVRIGNYKTSSLSAALDWRKRISGTSSDVDAAIDDPSAVKF
jgi:ribonucleoside-diphosphate reductase subunit M2